MRLEEVLPALRDGKKVAWRGHVFLSIGDLAMSTLNRVNLYAADDWSIVEEPLSDERLVQQWMFMAKQTAIAAGFASNRCSNTYEECARQLRERKL